MKKEEQIHDHNLWYGFLGLGEKYGAIYSIPEFGFCMLKFTFKMMFDCAPDNETVKKYAEEAMRQAYEWSLEDQND